MSVTDFFGGTNAIPNIKTVKCTFDGSDGTYLQDRGGGLDILYLGGWQNLRCGKITISTGGSAAVDMEVQNFLQVDSASIPSTPSGGFRFYSDLSNAPWIIDPSGSTYELSRVVGSGNASLGGTLSPGGTTSVTISITGATSADYPVVRVTSEMNAQVSFYAVANSGNVTVNFGNADNVNTYNLPATVYVGLLRF